jgi:hypothetical protein
MLAGKHRQCLFCPVRIGIESSSAGKTGQPHFAPRDIIEFLAKGLSDQVTKLKKCGRLSTGKPFGRLTPHIGRSSSHCHTEATSVPSTTVSSMPSQ